MPVEFIGMPLGFSFKSLVHVQVMDFMSSSLSFTLTTLERSKSLQCHPWPDLGAGEPRPARFRRGGSPAARGKGRARIRELRATSRWLGRGRGGRDGAHRREAKRRRCGNSTPASSAVGERGLGAR
jgi:hypothetical protein